MSVRHQDDQSVRSLDGWGPRSDQQRAIANVVGRALRDCVPVDPDSHNVAMLASGAAQESNLPTDGLHRPAGFEDGAGLALGGRSEAMRDHPSDHPDGYALSRRRAGHRVLLGTRGDQHPGGCLQLIVTADNICCHCEAVSPHRTIMTTVARAAIVVAGVAYGRVRV